jgi:hypothetical protein
VGLTKNKNMYPVPAFKSAKVSPVSSDIGTSTLYIAADAIPTIKVYTLCEAVDSHFRLGDQFRGSSGSALGAGTNTMSFSCDAEACFPLMMPSRSTRWTVPGIAVSSRWPYEDVVFDMVRTWCAKGNNSMNVKKQSPQALYDYISKIRSFALANLDRTYLTFGDKGAAPCV